MERLNRPEIGNNVINQSLNEFELIVRSLNALFQDLGKQYLENVQQPPRQDFS
ncbi:MAG: hypothetical protein HQL66_04960 [Magnetococcales bacterium]|nr:hypothetical protein [Magnetococcales bacterium]